ncbi:hypothetical protein HanXRQr2_Chr05g0236901 [Helianthus annuus]|uniref:Uncharacterized protein n=1 Tax=Helianthus annuus TaxID=4232 RepID=A0A9K3NNZ0_HELAN|nr:hypothetical protein HanXRQr2_Chr05g0236901 [Helianthus annuus]KAJ0924467.1 hypothetical protein HanPSC8_Chr05g0228491 [Helianthus annuus]
MNDSIPNDIYLILKTRVKYTDGPLSLPKFWIWSLAFQKYIDGPCGLQNFGLNALQSANHRDHPCSFLKS